ncbi:MAG: substrate-binding domain-containing protein, partial [Acutalibacteraceae bacterium]|nr:substrate-binding domain-containing protein [Acutalibacteraceae bacterium]
KKIADAKQRFCSRGDNSGTHNKEMKIWSASAPVLKLDPAWYTSVGSGMGDTLTKANEMNAYVLTDKATYLSMKDNLPNLDILVSESDDMKNTYSLIGVNPEASAFAGKDVKINTEGANALMEWLQGDEASALIEKYGIEEYGEQLFQLM